MSDGSVLLVEIKRGTLSRVTPDGTITVVAECGGGPNGAAIGPDGALLRLQQRRLRMARHGRAPRAGEPAGRLHRRPHPAGRPGDRQGDRPLRRLRGPRAPRSERPGLRHARRLLVHRPREDPRARPRPHGRLLRARRRLEHQGGDLPARGAERHRPLARRHEALRRRDVHGTRVDVGRRRAGRGRHPSSGSAAAHCSAGCPASSSSTRWRSTARATSASRRS